MTLIFPSKLEVQIKDASNNFVTDNLAVKLTLFANKKNDYHISGITKDGTKTFGIKEVREEIDFHKNTWLMDYTGELEDCKEDIKIEILSGADVDKAIEGHNLWKEAINNVQSKIEALRNVLNANYEPQALTVKLNDPKAEEKSIIMKTTRL